MKLPRFMIRVSVRLVACFVGITFGWFGDCAARETPQDRSQADRSVLEGFELHSTRHPKGEVAFTWDKDAYLALGASDLAELPIGVFDSGIGGLTVLESLLTLDLFNNDSAKLGSDGIPDLAGERFIYLGDQANMPYGNYPSKDREGFLRELILKDVSFLLGKRFHVREEGNRPSVRFSKQPVKAVVIACNTATAYGIQDLRELMAHTRLPLILVGVVDAGVLGVKNTPGSGAVGVLATIGTCLSRVYPKTISRMIGEEETLPVVSQWGSADLAAVIEGDQTLHKSVSGQAFSDVKALVEAHRDQQRAVSNIPVPLEKVVLGCTHFPLVIGDIDAAFEQLKRLPEYTEWIASKRIYINPAEWTARELFNQLLASHLRRPRPPVKEGAPGFIKDVQFFFSVPNEACPNVTLSSPGIFESAYKYGRHSGALDVEDTLVMPLGRSQLSVTTGKLVKDRLPCTWSLLPD